MTTFTTTHLELGGILVLGVLQPIIEILAGPAVAGAYNAGAAVVVIGYVLWRAWRQPGLWREWGVRLDNFWASVPAYGAVVGVIGVGLYIYGVWVGTAPLPITFFYLVVLYPLWGLGQQFALHNFVARHIRAFVPDLVISSLLTAAIFSFSHAPSAPLMLLTFLAGFVLTLLFAARPNIFVLGITHGLLGALAFYLVLGQDQWELLIGQLS